MLLSLVVFSLLGLFIGWTGPVYHYRKEAGGPGSFSMLSFPRWCFIPDWLCSCPAEAACSYQHGLLNGTTADTDVWSGWKSICMFQLRLKDRWNGCLQKPSAVLVVGLKGQLYSHQFDGKSSGISSHGWISRSALV